jgi:hypothetical protein
VEAIDLDTKLRLATMEISQDILDILIEHTTTLDEQAIVRRTTGVADVAVTPQMKRWHALHTLEIVYRDAYNNQLNDRYRLKWEEYQDLGRNARERTLRYGIGLVSNPMPIPGAPLFGIVAGLIAATTYYVQATWVGADGQESEPSAITTFTTVDASLLTVQLKNPPATAVGWNVYLGLNPKPLALQNSTPIAVGGMFTIAASGLVAGNPPGDGQAPDFFITGGRSLRRG